MPGGWRLLSLGLWRFAWVAELFTHMGWRNGLFWALGVVLMPGMSLGRLNFLGLLGFWLGSVLLFSLS